MTTTTTTTPETTVGGYRLTDGRRGHLTHTTAGTCLVVDYDAEGSPVSDAARFDRFCTVGRVPTGDLR